MRIKNVEVVNFRALRRTKISFNQLTSLVGENNAGKSAVLLALDHFFESSPSLIETDFSDQNTTKPIDITITFSDLTPDEQKEFGSNLIESYLTITRRFIFGNAAESGHYLITTKVNPDFTECRTETKKIPQREIYRKLQKKYPDLEDVANADGIEPNLAKWEKENPELLETKRIRSVSGFKNVSAGKIKKKTDFLLVKAVQDADQEIQQDKKSPIKTLIDQIARQTIENNKEYQEFMEEANITIRKLTDPSRVPVLSDISKELTTILSKYYGDSSINANWRPVDQLSTSFPTAIIQVIDKGFETPIGGVGHGLQRAVLLAVLQYMAEHQASGEAATESFSEAQSDIILVIEEPEIYQHPIKQRLFGQVFPKLCEEFNRTTGIRFQVIYSTHSPLLISLDRCEGIRILQSVSGDDGFNVEVSDLSLDRCSKRGAVLGGLDPEKAWSPETFASKLHVFGSEIREGFFAKKVVLVEGVGDKAVLEAMYKIDDRDPYAEGIVIVEVTGKSNLIRPVLIFQDLCIPCYWMFDNDKGASSDSEEIKRNKRENKTLQRLADLAAVDCEDWPNGVFPRFACWEGKIEKYFEEEAGDKFEKFKLQVGKIFEVTPNDCLKNPTTASALFLQLRDAGVTFKKLDQILERIDQLD